MEQGAVRIQLGVRGPGRQVGFLLEAPANEALDWDIRHEVASTSRHWMGERQAWWIAAVYLPTVRDILGRFPELALEDDAAERPAAAAPVPVRRALPVPLWERVLQRLRRQLAPF